MTDERAKQRGWAFWTTVTLLVLLLVVYPLSYGPYLCFVWATHPPHQLRKIGDAVYLPFVWAAVFGPSWVAPTIAEYEDWWVALGRSMSAGD